MIKIEFTDGKVKTIEDLLGYWDKSTRRISKSIVDLEPDIPNIVKDGIWASVYNNTLYAVATPIKRGLVHTTLHSNVLLILL